MTSFGRVVIYAWRHARPPPHLEFVYLSDKYGVKTETLLKPINERSS